MTSSYWAEVGPLVIEILSPGPPGASGSQWFSGSAVPAADLGAVGDYYLRANGDVYGPKASGGWGAVQFSLTPDPSLIFSYSAAMAIILG
jgi:hypothetical protein